MAIKPPRPAKECPPASDRHDHGKRDEQLPSTYLVIPYFSGDKGRPSIERPLSSSIVSWLCPSIVVNGQPGKNQFKRGEPTSVTVDVANWGAGALSAPVVVQLWWSDPSTGFTKKNLFGQSVVIAPTGGGVRRSPAIVGVIPASAPPHICFLAHVTSPLDNGTPGALAHPVNDRHWAQLNVAEVTTTVGQQFQFMVWVGNPMRRASTFAVEVRAVSRELLPALERIRRGTLTRPDRASLRLFELRRGGGDEICGGEREDRYAVTLEPGERRAVHMIGELPANTEPGTSAAFEIVQSVGEHDGQRVVGAVGLIVTARPH